MSPTQHPLTEVLISLAPSEIRLATRRCSRGADEWVARGRSEAMTGRGRKRSRRCGQRRVCRRATGVLRARRRVRRHRTAVSQSVTGRPCCDDETPTAAKCDPRRRHRRRRNRRRKAVARPRAPPPPPPLPCGRRPPCVCWCSSASTCRFWPSERLCSRPSRRRRRRPGSRSSRSSGKSSSTDTRVSEVRFVQSTSVTNHGRRGEEKRR